MEVSKYQYRSFDRKAKRKTHRLEYCPDMFLNFEDLRDVFGLYIEGCYLLDGGRYTDVLERGEMKRGGLRTLLKRGSEDRSMKHQ